MPWAHDKNGMWDVLSLPDPCNQEKTWDMFLNKFRNPLDYVKPYIKYLNRGSKADT